MITTEKRLHQLDTLHKESRDIFEKKNKDYADSFAKFGPIGVLVRLGDKLDRCVSISKSGISLVDDETLRDTLIDMHNYSAMALMLLDEKVNNDNK